MNKKRILFLSEFTQLDTGYARLYNKLMRELVKDDSIQIFELASYCHPQQHAQLMSQIPWKVYGNLPTTPEEEQMYNSSPVGEFGAWKFEATCLDCFPHIVVDLRDYWMISFVDQSPFRRFFKTVLMPTCDGRNQHIEWLDFYKRADYILSYTGWSEKVLQEEGGGLINTVGVGGYAVDPNLYQMAPNKKQHKLSLGVRDDAIIIGMVSRNQKRKLYPRLAEAFVEFLKKMDEETSKNVFLYWHTSHPDLGWNIPELVLNNGLAHKILFSYSCQNCKLYFPAFYRDARTTCPRCKTGSVILSNSQQGVSEQDLVNVYNLFDLYVQYVSNEGFGLSQVEAGSCGVPVCGTNYTSMEEIVPNLGGYLVPVKDFWTEAETGRTMAFPDNTALVEYIKKFISLPESVRNSKRLQTRELAIKYYGSWKDVGNKWLSVINKIEPDNNLWGVPPQIINSPPNMPDECNRMAEEQFISWLLTNVMGEPRLVNSYQGLKMMRDLIWGRTTTTHVGMFSNDLSMLGSRPQYRSFNRNDLYNYVRHFRENANRWEMHRWDKIQSMRTN